MSKTEDISRSSLPINNGTVPLTNWEQVVQNALESVNDPDSHVERNPDVFHPSQLAYCIRQAYLAKLGLKDNSEILGIFQTGSLIHEFLEEHADVEGAIQEHPVEYEVDGIHIKGTVDYYHPVDDVVVDWKSRGSFYRFSPPSDRHLNQLTLYQAALGKPEARIVYISKKDLEVRPWPENDTHSFDAERFDTLIEKAKRIQAEIDENGIAESEDEIPFEKCGCYICDNEELEGL